MVGAGRYFVSFLDEVARGRRLGTGDGFDGHSLGMWFSISEPLIEPLNSFSGPPTPLKGPFISLFLGCELANRNNIIFTSGSEEHNGAYINLLNPFSIMVVHKKFKSRICVAWHLYP